MGAEAGMWVGFFGWLFVLFLTYSKLTLKLNRNPVKMYFYKEKKLGLEKRSTLELVVFRRLLLFYIVHSQV